MKKCILILSMLCLGTIAMKAQFTPGIKGGVTLGDVSNVSGGNRVTGHVGLFLHHTINSNWCIQPEVLYSGAGQKFMTANGEHTLALSYIQVPVMVQYYPIKELYFELGPQVSFLTSAHDKGSNGKAEVDGSYNKADFGLNIGAGVAATSKLGFYGRYGAGLTDISKTDNIERRNRTGQIGMYVRLK